MKHFIKDLKPARALAELVVIIVGVLTALGVDEWREVRGERVLEAQYLQGLATDVRQDLARMDVLDVQILNRISGAFNANWLRDFTNDDPNEVVDMPAWETGWLLIDGGTASSGVKSVSDPAFLAALIDLGRTGSAALPFGIGEQDNGDLLPSGVFGDF